LPLTPLLSGVAVVDGIRAACGLQAELEWPNDVMVADRKLAGILVRHPPGDAVIVGIGINVSAHPGSAEVAAPATAIAEALHRPVDREPVLAAILAALDAYLETAREGPTPILDAYRRRTSMLGKRIAYVMDGADRIAIARDVLEDGRLLVELPDGGLAQLVAGRVRQVRDPRA
ncbi:MAG TPA: biotin--[acetyl-CoA-carboxylase] ligase, partial [Candidatus Limnocylindrales bacterium]|nr:biotin--[acetyl-CoA-carboxylase] ligase [Candidatus Limnocylindrales bacterium]